MATTKKTIQFLLPGAGIAGGIRVVFQYAEYLQNQGHTVRLYYPGVMWPQHHSFWLLERTLRTIKYALETKNEGKTWFPLTVPLFHVPSLEARYIPPADITIATGNATADWVAELPADRGEKFYFIQDWEVWDRSESAIAATWHLPLRKITISSSLKKIADTLGVPIEAVITNGIDQTVFYNTHKKLNNPPHLLMMGHTDERKGMQDGFAALKQIHSRYPNIPITVFGAHSPHSALPHFCTYIEKPSQNRLRELYADADIFLSPSWAEGCQLPPMEAMSCACAVVATNVGGIPDYAIAGKTALVVEPKHPDLLAEACMKLIEDPDYHLKICLAGQKHIADFTLEKAARRFMQAILADAP